MTIEAIKEEFLQQVAQVAQDGQISCEVAYEIWVEYSDDMMEAVLNEGGIDLYE